MRDRSEQREKTRHRIVDVAVDIFAARGFLAASTREIAARAKVSQGLITYHFGTKSELWKAAIGRIFDDLRAGMREGPNGDGAVDPTERVRDVVRHYVRFVAAHPELFRVMVEEGKHSDTRMRWLVDTHLTPLYAGFVHMISGVASARERVHPAHVYYAMAGAASLIFAVAPECTRLTGFDPRSPEAVEAHAEMLARLLAP